MDDRVVFLQVLEAGSFTDAASTLGVSTSYVSRRVRALEEQLGVRLLERTTRSVQPTDIGASYATRVGPLLEALADADLEVRDEQRCPSGRLRVALPMAFGLRYLQPLVEAYATQYGDIRLEVSYSDLPSDLLGDRFDVAVRGGRLADSSFSARRLCGMRSVLIASPDYLARRGLPAHPKDLAHHDGIEYSAARSHEPWALTCAGEEVRVRPAVRVSIDSGEAAVALAIAGLGVAQQPTFLCHEALADGRLVHVLPEWTGFDGAFWALTPSRRYQPRKVRLFIETLVEGLRDVPDGDWSTT